LKTVDSQALGILNKQLGITGRGAQVTELLDGTLEQTFDTGPAVRRGRTLAATTGLVTGTLSNVHTVAETLTSSIEPYAVAVGAIAPYPTPVPDTLDVWLLAATARQFSGTGTFTGSLFLDYPNATQGWGINDSGAAVVRQDEHAIIVWDSILAVGPQFALMENGQPWQRLGLRLPRGGTILRWRSISSAAATFDCQLLMGLFPVALGQDVTL